MNRSHHRDGEQASSLDRRRFLTGAAALGVAAGAAAASAPARAEVRFPKEPGQYGAPARNGFDVDTHRSENTLYDCEVEGDIPDDLDGAFYRVGPDAQYPKPAGMEYDIGFDGEGHASVFHIRNSHVDYTSRWIRNPRWKAQHEARRSLFGVYRNRYSDDPSVRNVSRATQNTQVWYHDGRILAMKEDSMPAALDPLTLETLDANYRFDGGIQGETFTAHPKNDSHTGNLVAFGYEARGLGTRDIEIFEISPQGKTLWSAWVQAPYTSEIHDFAVTEKHVVFVVYPLAYIGEEKMRQGGIHWAWDPSKDTYLGVLRRGGDGKDVRWVKGPQMMCPHTMGCWTDGNRVFVDMDGSDGNTFPIFAPFDPGKAASRLRRLSLDTRRRNPRGFDCEILYPLHGGALSRQDDRYHTVPYRYGFQIGGGPDGAGWLRMDHQTGKVDVFNPGPDAALSEMCFVPRRKGAPEGDGYLVGICNRLKENRRSDLLILDAQRIAEGPLATVRLPYRAAPQVHGFWVPGEQLRTPA